MLCKVSGCAQFSGLTFASFSPWSETFENVETEHEIKTDSKAHKIAGHILPPFIVLCKTAYVPIQAMYIQMRHCAKASIEKFEN